MKTKVLVLSLCLSLFIGLFFTADTNALSTLALTLTTDQPFYRLQMYVPSTINVVGNLTLNGTRVSDGLVALTVFQGKIGHYVRPILFRTVATGSLPPQNWSLNVSLGVLGLRGSQYVPQTVFTRPSSQTDQGPAFNITLKNTASLLKLYLTLTIFDAAKVPIITMNVTKIDQPIPPGSLLSIIVPPTPLKGWAALGNATAYVSAFDNMPPYEYFPYCPEASSRFTIVPSGGGQMSTQENLNTPTERISSSINGNYNLTFKINYYQALPFYIPWGNYTVEASSSYQGKQAINSHTFWVRIPGDVNGDGVVNVLDINPIARYWQRTVPPAPAYADLNGDGIINLLDLNWVAVTWLKREQPLP